MQVEQLISELTRFGGALVSSNACSEFELADAKSDGRFAETADGQGYVLRTQDWLDLIKRRDECGYLSEACDCCEQEDCGYCIQPNPDTQDSLQQFYSRTIEAIATDLATGGPTAKAVLKLIDDNMRLHGDIFHSVQAGR